MKKALIFEYLDYKIWLRAWLDLQGHGSISRLAGSLKCQRSYISQVLTTHIQLTPDQCFLLAQVAVDSEIEKQYLKCLVEFARAGSMEYKHHLQQEMQRLQKESQRIEKLVERDQDLKASSASHYFSAWYWSAIHILTSLDRPLNTKQISEVLGLEALLVGEILSKLEYYGLVSSESGTYKFKSGGLHLNEESPLLPQFHQMWRQKAITQFSEKKQKEGVHFTVVQTLSALDALEFQKSLRELIRSFEKLAGPSKSEVLVNFNLDFSTLVKSPSE